MFNSNTFLKQHTLTTGCMQSGKIGKSEKNEKKCSGEGKLIFDQSELLKF